MMAALGSIAGAIIGVNIPDILGAIKPRPSIARTFCGTILIIWLVALVVFAWVAMP